MTTLRTFLTPSAVVNVMVKAAFKAGRGLLRDFGEVENLQVSRKGPGNFVSIADRRSEQTIYQELKKARPEFGFLMEESGAVGDQSAPGRWIVDPLDGTTNFLHGVPHFCISIALEKEGEITHACIYDPLRDEVFWAQKGTGVFLNNRKITVAKRRYLDEVLISINIPYACTTSDPRMKALLSRVSGARQTGSAALDLAYVAAGRFDFFWQKNLAIWDTAAGTLLITEAGGLVNDPSAPDSQGEIIASNMHLYASFLKLMNQAVDTEKI